MVVINREIFFQSLKKTFAMLSQPNADYVKLIKQIEYYFNKQTVPAELNRKQDQILLLRNEILTWLIEFPAFYQYKLVANLKANYAPFERIVTLFGHDEIHYFVSMKITEITPRLITLLGYYIQSLARENKLYYIHDFNQIDFKEYLIRDFYYPLIRKYFHENYSKRLKNFHYDLDHAIQQTPKSLNQVSQHLLALKNALLTACNKNIKIKVKLSRDISELVDAFATAIDSHDFHFSVFVLEKFHVVWIADLNKLGGLYPIVEAYLGLVLSWLTFYSMIIQLAWMIFYFKEMNIGMTLLSISAGFFIYPQPNRFFKPFLRPLPKMRLKKAFVPH